MPVTYPTNGGGKVVNLPISRITGGDNPAYPRTLPAQTQPALRGPVNVSGQTGFQPEPTPGPAVPGPFSAAGQVANNTLINQPGGNVFNQSKPGTIDVQNISRLGPVAPQLPRGQAEINPGGGLVAGGVENEQRLESSPSLVESALNAAVPFTGTVLEEIPLGGTAEFTKFLVLSVFSIDGPYAMIGTAGGAVSFLAGAAAVGGPLGLAAIVLNLSVGGFLGGEFGSLFDNSTTGQPGRGEADVLPNVRELRSVMNLGLFPPPGPDPRELLHRARQEMLMTR